MGTRLALLHGNGKLALGKYAGAKTVAAGSVSKLGILLLIGLAIPIGFFEVIIATTIARRRKRKRTKARPMTAPMVKNRTKSVVLLGLAVLTTAVVVTGLWIAYDFLRPHTVTIAAGNTQDE